MLSIIIPSRNEFYLSQTVNDLFAKARGEIEVIAVIDEQDQPLEPRPNLIVYKKIGKPGMKSAINQAVEIARGEYILKTDGHCMFGEGFDVILVTDCKPNWIVIPRRYSLDAEVTPWRIKPNRPIVDYEYIVFPLKEVTSVRNGGKWYVRAEERFSDPRYVIDETMVFQGSCWMMKKDYYLNTCKLEINPKTRDEFILEPEELAFKSWLSGGAVMVNKKTWYAHYHKHTGHRGYRIDKRTMRLQREWHIDYWMHDRWPKATIKIADFVRRFMPIPGWPLDWETNPFYEQDYLRRVEANHDPKKIMV